jgi:hypothetical protein
VPTPLAKLFEQFDMLLVTAGMLRREVKRLEQAEAAGELSEAIRRGWFPDKGCRLHPAESEVLRAEPHRDPVLKSIQLNRDLQRCGQEVFKHLPSAVDWLDDPADAAQKRWTVRVDADVRELLGCLYRGQPNDVELSDLPWPDQGIVDAMWPVMERLEHLLHDLRSVERTRAAPITVPLAVIENNRGDLDAAEVAALLQLGERDIWGVDELPETIDADMLRCLDRHGMVQARIVVMQNQAKHPGDRTPPRPSPQGWVSPIQQPELAGDWDAVVAWHIRDSQRYPSQVRLSDVGKAERAKTLRTVGGAAGGEAGTSQSRRVGDGMTWQEAQKKAVYLVKHTYRGNPPTRVELTKKVKCARNTMAKAIERSEYLKARYAEVKARGGSLDEPLTDQHMEQAALAQEEELRRLVKDQADDDSRHCRKPRRSARS